MNTGSDDLNRRILLEKQLRAERAAEEAAVAEEAREAVLRVQHLASQAVEVLEETHRRLLAAQPRTAPWEIAQVHTQWVPQSFGLDSIPDGPTLWLDAEGFIAAGSKRPTSRTSFRAAAVEFIADTPRCFSERNYESVVAGCARLLVENGA
jgi:hypothetical protein